MRDFHKYPTILFDLDGTLTDSKDGIIRSLRYSLEKFGIVEDDTEKLTRCIGPSLSYTYKEWYGMGEEDARRAKAYYREYFDREGIFENRLFDGVTELLKALSAAGKRLVIATAKPVDDATRILAYLQVKSYFHGIYGSNRDGTRENKNEVIAFALDSLSLEGVNRETALMVGDRHHDILGARESALPAIAVGYGYGAAEELAAARPDGFANSVKELSALLIG